MNKTIRNILILSTLMALSALAVVNKGLKNGWF